MSKSGVPIVSDVAKVAGKVVKPVAKALKPIAPILPFIPIPGMFGLSSLLTKSLLTGALGGFGKDGKFDLGRGLTSGALAYGLGSLMSPATAGTAPTGGTLDGSSLTPDYDPFGSAADLSAAGISGSVPAPVTPSVSLPVPSSGYDGSGLMANYDPLGSATDLQAAGISGSVPPTPAPIGAPTTYAAAETIPTVDVTGGTEIVGGRAPIETAVGTPGAGAARPTLGTGEALLDLAGSVGEAAVDSVKNMSFKDAVQLGTLGFTGYGAITTKKELERQKEEAERILSERRNKTAAEVAQAQRFLQDFPLLYQRLTAEDVRTRGLASGGMASYDDELGRDDGMAMGGIAGLAKGGMPPRYLRGGGDGMSDSIRARIGGKQEARLADGEFVVPADVVSHIGNGSSNAGAKKLYAMMDRARQARTGKTRQAPAVNAQRYMPA
jgi:hypothetical protein